MTGRRILTGLGLLVVVAVGLLTPASAVAHPLGNFTVNRLDVIRVSEDRVDVRWILDQAEIPTFQERDRPPEEVLAAKRAEALRGLELSVDGERVKLTADGDGTIAMLRGQGGLETTRVELLLTASVDGAREVTLRDTTFSGRLGWRGIIVAPGEGTATTSDLPANEPTSRLRNYPTEVLQSPAEQREIVLNVEPGDGTVVAPRAEGGGLATTRAEGGQSEDGFAGLLEDATNGDGVLILLLAAAFGWGALHALSPGHGKTMVAAYLVGARGTARHAVMLGATVTVTHTIGVFALGGVTLALSQYLLPEDLYPWLNLVAGLLVLLVGALVLRARLRGIPEGHHHGSGGHTHGPAGHTHDHAHAAVDHDHEHAVSDHDHEHAAAGHVHAHAVAEHEHEHAAAGHGHSHAAAERVHEDASPEHVHTHATAEDDHQHGAHDRQGAARTHAEHDHAKHHNHAPDSLRPRVLLAAGASAGLIPCPSALVVLLGAVAQQEIALGFLLITVFSLGLAATLTVLGLLVVHARGLSTRWRPGSTASRFVTVIPSVSAVVIVLVGVLLTIRAIPDIV